MKWIILSALGLALVTLGLSGTVSRNQLALQLVKDRDFIWNHVQFTSTPGHHLARPCTYLLRVASYMQIEPSPRSISRHCETAALAELWDARQLWMEHKPEEACDIWWKLNAAPDIWIVVQATSEEQDWNDLQASLQCLDRWREASSDAPSINTIYTGWVAEKYVQLAEHQQAEGNISGALASADRAYIWLPAKIDGRVTLLKARLLMEQQGIDAAEQWVMAATAASNDQSYLHITWLNWAEYLIGKGEIDRAIAGYQKAIQTAPEQGSYAYERLASSYMGMKRPLEAIDALNAGVDSVSSEQQAPLFLLLGQIYEQTGDPGAAYCAYQAVLQRVTDTQSSTATTAAERSAALTAILAAPAVCE